MTMEGGLNTVQQIVLVVVAAIILIGMAIYFSGKIESTGCTWTDQISSVFNIFAKIAGEQASSSVCG